MEIGIVIFPEVEELDFVGPWEMFGMWVPMLMGQENDITLLSLPDR